MKGINFGLLLYQLAPILIPLAIWIVKALLLLIAGLSEYNDLPSDLCYAQLAFDVYCISCAISKQFINEEVGSPYDCKGIYGWIAFSIFSHFVLYLIGLSVAVGELDIGLAWRSVLIFFSIMSLLLPVRILFYKCLKPS